MLLLVPLSPQLESPDVILPPYATTDELWPSSCLFSLICGQLWHCVVTHALQYMVYCFLSSSKASLLLYLLIFSLFPFSSHPHSRSTAHFSELLECISCIYTSNPSSICLFWYVHIHENSVVLQLHKRYYAVGLILFSPFQSTLGFGDLSVRL